VRVVNWVPPAWAAEAEGEISADDLLEQARRDTGLSDFGDLTFDEGLRVYVDALNREARLNRLGMITVRTEIVRMLSNRLRFARDLERHPEILEEQLERPIVILGLARTGTTKLQRTISADPGVQRLELWRLLNPAPWRPAGGNGQDPRIAFAEVVEAELLARSPDVMAAHALEAHEPDEETLLLELTFGAMTRGQVQSYRTPSYVRWLAGQSKRKPYGYMRMLLQYLQWQDGGARGRPWIMKTPLHLGELATLLGTFPDALVVHCHRDPLEAIPSVASLIEAARGMRSDDADPLEIGAEVVDRFSWLIGRALEARETLPVDSFIDLSFRAIVSDVNAVIAAIYSRAGMQLTAEALSAFDAYESRRPVHHFGRHVYTAERYGLDAPRIASAFASYYDAFPDLLA
jgi:Sulfotransferase family